MCVGTLCVCVCVCVCGLPGEPTLRGLDRANTCRRVWAVSSSGGVALPVYTACLRHTRLSPVFRITQPVWETHDSQQASLHPLLHTYITWYFEAEGGNEGREGREEVKLEVQGETTRISESGMLRVWGGEHSHVARPAVLFPQLPAEYGIPVNLQLPSK